MEITPSYASASSTDIAGGGGGGGRPVKVIPFQALSGPRLSAGRFKRMTWLEWVEFLFPCVRWIRTYDWREYLLLDLMAGITIGIMLVPQEMDSEVSASIWTMLCSVYKF